jgi:hypothetical protein
MVSKSIEVSQAIKQIIQTLMNRFMDIVLLNDSFILEEHKGKKPLYAALLPSEIFIE